MPNHPPSQPPPERLPEPAAERLLARASELDADRRAGSAVADLRAAAAEAGISAHAFDEALAELNEDGSASVADVQAKRRRGSRKRALNVAVATLLAVGAIWFFKRLTPADNAALPGAPIVEEAIVLRCLSPGEAAELIRPLLVLPSNTMVARASAPRVLTIRATAAQLENVKAVLEAHEGVGAPACAARPSGTGTP